MIRSVKLLTASFLLLIISSLAVSAQENSAKEVEALRKKLNEQEAQIKHLQENLQRQSEMLARQMTMLEALQQKIEPPAVTNAAQTRPSSLKPVEEKPAPQATESVEAGTGKIKLNGVLQGWFASGNEGLLDTFRLRRAQVRFTGEINPRVKWTLMVDAAKALSVRSVLADIGNGRQALTDLRIDQSTGILQDAYLTLDYIPKVHLDAGQMKVPLSLEMLQQAPALDTVERALFISDRLRGGIGVSRDIGVMMRGRALPQVDYQIGVFNGSGEHQNDSDRNDQKALIGRAIFRAPFIKGLQVGTSGTWGNGQRPDRPRRDRAGAELLFARGDFKFKSEVMGIVDGDVHRLGYYAHLGYRINPKIEAVFRFDSFDPNTRLETSPLNATERDYLAGVNYYIDENRVKLQFNYLRKTFEKGLAPSRNLFLVNLQTAW